MKKGAALVAVVGGRSEVGSKQVRTVLEQCYLLYRTTTDASGQYGNGILSLDAGGVTVVQLGIG